MLATYDGLIESADEASRAWLSKMATNGWAVILVLSLLTFASYLPSQSRLPAVDRTEPLVAVVARDMIASRDILRPAHRGTLQINRPAGTFWLQGLVAAAAGNDAQHGVAIYRLPSLVATTLAVILMFFMLRGLIGPLPAFVASMMVAVTPIVVLQAHLAIAEPIILPAIVAVQLLAMRLYSSPPFGKWEQRRLAMTLWAVLGISTWFNALAVPLLSFVTVATLSACDRNLSLARRLEPHFGVPVMLLFALPWLIALSAKGGGLPLSGLGFWDILEILESGQAEKITFVPGAYILTLAIGFVPAAYMLGPVLRRLWAQRYDSIIRFCLVWFWAPLVALEILSNEPPLYTVQAIFPAGAILIALAITPDHRAYLAGLKPWTLSTVMALLLVLVAGPALVGALLYSTATPLQIANVIGYGLVALLFVLACRAAVLGRMWAWFSFGCAGAWMLNVWFFAILMPSLQNFWTAPQLEQIALKIERCDPGSRIDLFGFREPSAVLALGDRVNLKESWSTETGNPHVTIIESRDQPASAEQDQNRVYLGCFLSMNIARPMFLSFKVFAPANNASLSNCALDLPQNCGALGPALDRWR